MYTYICISAKYYDLSNYYGYTTEVRALRASDKNFNGNKIADLSKDRLKKHNFCQRIAEKTQFSTEDRGKT